jgi:hypothetical protein
MLTLEAELALRTVKLTDIGFVTTIYFLLGIFSARIFDNFYGKYDAEKEEKKGMLRRTFEIIGMMWLYGIIIYFVRNLVELIPSPFDGLFSYKHGQLKELKSASVFTFVFLFFQLYFKDKLAGYYKNLKF